MFEIICCSTPVTSRHVIGKIEALMAEVRASGKSRFLSQIDRWRYISWWYYNEKNICKVFPKNVALRESCPLKLSTYSVIKYALNVEGIKEAGYEELSREWVIDPWLTWPVDIILLSWPKYWHVSIFTSFKDWWPPTLQSQKESTGFFRIFEV